MIGPLRILFVNAFYAPEIGGGAELSLHRIATGLRARGHVTAAFTTGELESIDDVDGVMVYRFPIDNAFRKLDRELPHKARRIAWQWRDRSSQLMAQRLNRVIDEFKPDVIQFHNLPGITRSVWAVPRARRIPSIQVLHDLNLICPSSSMFKDGKSCTSQCGSCALFRRGFAKSSRDVDRLVGVSRFVIERITKEGYFAAAKKRVIYNAQMLPGPSPLGQGAVRFGYIGALTAPKGVEWLVDQFTADMGTLVIAGTGGSDFVEQLKIRAKGKPITFAGHVESRDFFPTIDVGIVPSIWNDTLPGVAIEGGAHGRPVIASRRGGLPEIVRDGETGLLVDPDRPETLGLAMRALAGDRSRLVAMAAAAPAAVKRFTSLDRWLDEYTELYGDLIAGSGRSRLLKNISLEGQGR